MTTYKYPQKLNSEITPFIMLSAFKWSTKGKKSQSVTSNKSIEDMMVLPLPQNGIINNIANNWTEDNIMRSSDMIEGWKAQGMAKARDFLSGIGGRYHLHKKGQAINDFSSLLYSGVAMRDFNFTWSLVPESKEESIIIRDMIKAFKRNCLPEYSGWRVFYPHFWKIRVVFPGNYEPIIFNDCVLTALTDSYFEEEKYVFNTGHPTKITLMTTFKELDRLNRSQYKE